MALIWWLPAVILINGSLLLLLRLRRVEQAIASTAAATARLAALGESGAALTAEVARTESRRARTTHNLGRGSATTPDRERHGTDR